MPAWIHDRAEHLLAKNPSMPKGQAFALATQQGHALGKSPKGYGTSDGRERAKEKYPTPKDDKKTANPGGLTSAKLGAAFIDGFGEELLKLAFATSTYSAPLNPIIESGASKLPGFKAPQLRAALQKSAEGAPTRGGFAMASDVPAFKGPNLRTGIQKDGDMLPDGVTYNASDFKRVKFTKRGAAALTPMGRLAQTKAVGMPKVTAPPGPSIAEIAKPKGPGFGSGISGAYKGTIGGTAGNAQL